jgi:hypothetical protein
MTLRPMGRQAAAMTAELFRLPTQEEARRFEQVQARMGRETAEDTEQMRRELWAQPAAPSKDLAYDPRPLDDDERCIGGQRSLPAARERLAGNRNLSMTPDFA